MLKKTLLFSIFILSICASAVIAKDSCEPEFDLDEPVQIIQPLNNDDKKSTYIYFDQSLSMQGYTKDQPGQNNLYVNVIDDLQQIAENVGSKTYYHSFGKTIKPIKELKARAKTYP